MALYTDGWCRIEGANIPDLEKTYGSAFTSLPSNTVVFYGAPEIQIYNKLSLTSGVVYKIIKISDLGYENMQEIDANYNTLLSDISNLDKTVNLGDSVNAAQYYYEPFTIDESSVILYTDSLRGSFNRNAIIYVDAYATPEVITISGRYTGNPVPVGDTFSLDDIQLYAIYSDGNKLLVKEGYTVDPEDRIITKLNSNLVTITFTARDNTIFTSQIVIEGVRKLIGISAVYDGPTLTSGQEVQRRYLIVTANYSDGSSATVTNFSFPNGNIVGASGIIDLYYSGFYVQVAIPMYNVSTSRLIAYYNGPNVEVGHDFDITKAVIRIYYQSSDALNSYYESIDPTLCTFIPTTIEKEGVNQITVQYVGKAGAVTTHMIVAGITPEVTLNFIVAEYTGPEVYVGKSFSLERVICKAHYSDGSVVTIKNRFSVQSNVVNLIGINEFLITYKEKDTTVTSTFTVIGIENDSTTDTTYNPIYLDNNYPVGTRLNHRYRGPAEANKQNNINYMIFENIKNLYKLFANIEKSYNQLIEVVDGDNAVKFDSLNSVYQIENEVNNILSDTRFSTGKYIKEEENE